MKVSRTIAYAVHATLQLAQSKQGVPVPCSQLAHQGQMPERFLLQILRSLVTHGLLHSTRGVDGGYYLARPADQITLRDIVESFDNPLKPSVPPLEGLPPAVLKQLEETLRVVSNAALRELQRLTVADLLRVCQPGPDVAGAVTSDGEDPLNRG